MTLSVLALLLQVLACSATEWYDSVAAHTRLPYNKSAVDCYTGSARTQPTIVTTLLHDKNFADSRVARTLPNLLSHTAADVGLFHTSWTDNEIADLRAQLPYISFVTCIAPSDWEAPDFRPGESVERGFKSAGYRSMCRWYSSRVGVSQPWLNCKHLSKGRHCVQMFRALNAMGYIWVIRVDDDSGFPKLIPYDVVSVMEAKNAMYGFRVMNQDMKPVTKALAEAARYWLVSESITPTFLFDFCDPQSLTGLSSDGWSPHIFYNNFFVTNIQFWMRPDIQAWLKLLECANGFHKFRWGDAPVHTVTLAIFASAQQVLEFGFEYEHQGVYPENYSTSVFKSLNFYHDIDAVPDLLEPKTK